MFLLLKDFDFSEARHINFVFPVSGGPIDVEPGYEDGFPRFGILK